MEGYQIALLVIGIIVSVYLIFVLIDFIFFVSFKVNLKKHTHAIAVFLQSKYDNIHKLLELVNKYAIPVNTEYVNKYTQIDTKCFSSPDTPSCIAARATLNQLKNEIVVIVRGDEILNKHNEIKQALSSIEEMDTNYRMLVATYNADVIGYNYWIHFLPTRYIYKLAKVNDKQIIA